MVTSKFKCVSCVPSDANSPKDGGTVTLEPVIDGSEENKTFYKYTPSGKIVLGTVNPSAYAQFVEGREYLVHFVPVLGSERTE